MLNRRYYLGNASYVNINAILTPFRRIKYYLREQYAIRVLRFCAGTCSANLNQARVGEPRIFKHAMLHVSYFLP